MCLLIRLPKVSSLNAAPYQKKQKLGKIYWDFFPLPWRSIFESYFLPEFWFAGFFTHCNYQIYLIVHKNFSFPFWAICKKVPVKNMTQFLRTFFFPFLDDSRSQCTNMVFPLSNVFADECEQFYPNSQTGAVFLLKCGEANGIFFTGWKFA